MSNTPKQKQSHCGRCNWKGNPEKELHEIHHLHTKIDPGSIVPSGECPECGALCYLDGRPPKPDPRACTPGPRAADVNECAAIAGAEYFYWRDGSGIAIGMAGMGAAANILCAINGFRAPWHPQPPQPTGYCAETAAYGKLTQDFIDMRARCEKLTTEHVALKVAAVEILQHFRPGMIGSRTAEANRALASLQAAIDKTDQ